MKLFILATLLAINSICFAKNAVITGHSDVIPDSTEIILFHIQGQTGKSIARDTVVNGNFKFIVPVDSGLIETEIMTFSPAFPQKGRIIYLSPDADVKVDATGYYIHTWPVNSNIPEQAEYDRFLINSKELWSDYQQCMLNRDKALQSVSNNAEHDSLNNVLEHISDSLKIEISHRDIAMLQTSKPSPIWLKKFEDLARTYQFYEQYPNNFDGKLRQLYASLDNNIQDSAIGYKLNRLLYPPKIIEVGDTLPDGEFFDIKGGVHHLSDFRGKWLLIDLWSSGCYASILAIDELKKFAANNADTTEVVMLSVDNDNTWREASAAYSLIGNNWNEGKEDVGLYLNFGAQGYPTFVFVSPEGVIKNIFLSFYYGQFDEMLHQYINCPN